MTTYYKGLNRDGFVISESYIENDLFSRLDGPCYIEYDNNSHHQGAKKYEKWMVNGIFHNENGPAEVFYSDINNGISEQKYYIKGVLHRDDGPAHASKYKCTFYQNGKIHRDGGPAIIEKNWNGDISSLQYYNQGILHREDGPAVIDLYSKRYYINGEIYREDGPAVILRDKHYRISWSENSEWFNGNDNNIISEQWYSEGVIHKDNGPAITNYDKKGKIKNFAYVYKGNVIWETKSLNLNIYKKKLALWFAEQAYA